MFRLLEPLNLASHAIVATAIGLVAPFTGFAWPFALLTGIVISRSDIERMHGLSASRGQRVTRVLAVTGGVLAMMVAGVLIGGLISCLVAALAGFSERLSADASPADQGLARIAVFVGGGLGWIVLGSLLGFHLSVHIGL